MLDCIGLRTCGKQVEKRLEIMSRIGLEVGGENDAHN